MDMELERRQRLRLTESYAPQNDVRMSQTFRERDRERERGREDFQMGSSLRKENEWDSVLFDDDMRMSLAFNQTDKVQDMDTFRARSEYKNAITEMSRRHEAEKGMLTEEVGMLKERVSTLISQNKDCNSYFNLVVPVPPILDGDENKDISDRSRDRDRDRADCSKESDEENRMVQNPLALALTSERANSSTLSARLDSAKESISFLTAQVSSAAGLSGELEIRYCMLL
jgi:hypothetical protein